MQGVTDSEIVEITLEHRSQEALRAFAKEISHIDAVLEAFMTSGN